MEPHLKLKWNKIVSAANWLIDWVGFNVPLNTLVISGTGFYGSNGPTNSVKALKEVVVLRIGFNPTRSTSPCYNNYTFIQYTVIQKKIHKFTYIHKNESKHSEMSPVRQNPIQRPVSLFICVCIALCTIVAHNIAQNRPDNFPPYPPDNHHCSDDVYLREGGGASAAKTISFLFTCGSLLKYNTKIL